MVKRGESGDLGGVWLKSHRLLRCSEVLSISSRVWRVALCLQMRSPRATDGPLWGHQGLTLTMLTRPSSSSGERGEVSGAIRTLATRWKALQSAGCDCDATQMRTGTREVSADWSVKGERVCLAE